MHVLEEPWPVVGAERYAAGGHLEVRIRIERIERIGRVNRKSESRKSRKSRKSKKSRKSRNLERRCGYLPEESFSDS